MIHRSTLNPPSFFHCILVSLFLGGILCADLKAIPEQDYAKNYTETVAPFLASGKRISFPSANGSNSLSAIYFSHPNEQGLIVVLNGFSQSWLQYGELFYDLYSHGYSVVSYDHRGQGLSPHLVATNSQIGHVEQFSDYADDLKSFMEHVVQPIHPSEKGLFLIAHSMGGAVAADYLEEHPAPPPFQAAVFCAPMFQINTAPYPPWAAQTLVTLLKTLGLGEHYAPGKGDYKPDEDFSKNRVTHSLPRWQMDQDVKKSNPAILIGGPSIAWVETSLSETSQVRSRFPQLSLPILILQAGEEELVMNRAEAEACEKNTNCKLLPFPEAKHEILMEQDPIRNEALSEIFRFFGEH